MNSNGVLNSNRFVEKLGIQMLLRNVIISMSKGVCYEQYNF